MEDYDDIPLERYDHVTLVQRRSTRRRRLILVGVSVLLLVVGVVALIAAFAPKPSASTAGALFSRFPSDGDAMEFFNQSDALAVTWYHGANSLAQMEEALTGNYMMLEGDIHLRWYGYENQTNEPVMMHDPGDSDNTLDNWLNNILARTDKAPKLDFKSMAVVEPSLQILSTKTVNHPIWMNADVVRGPGGGIPKFDPDEFLALVNQYFPHCTLSLGWTTSCCLFPYTAEMMDTMYSVTQRTPQHITFPARAGLLRRSWEEFRGLLMRDPERFSITVWTPSGRDDWEQATPWDMIYVRNDVNKTLIYYDLPGPKFETFRRDSVTAGTPLNHFHELATWDALNVSWAHAVNSQAQLMEALQGDIMMLEADVLLRGQGTDNQTDVPIMAHPPATDSDITLEEWITQVSPTTKGIKLDFKSVEVLEPAMKVLQKFEYSQPVWLNADILKGPGDLTGTPVNATEFKRIVNAYFPACTWSIGWTTKWRNLPGDRDEVYTEQHVDEMLEYVKDVLQPVTYPIRAAMVARSWPQLRRLLDASRQSTITVWSGSADNVDVDGLVTMRNESEPHRVFYDLPEELMNEFLDRIKP